MEQDVGWLGHAGLQCVSDWQPGQEVDDEFDLGLGTFMSSQ